MLLTGFWSCATYQAPPPSLYIGSLPPSLVAELTLEERILAEEVWTDLKQGRGSKAEKAVSRLGMDSPIYNVSLGYIDFLASKMQSAEKFFRLALQERPELALAHAGLAQIYQKSGRDDQAFAALREVLKTEPENPWAKQEYEALKNRKMKEVKEEARTALAEGDTKRAKAALLKALYYSPQDTESHLTLADIYINENKLQNALVHMKAATTSDPGNKEILKKYAETLSQAGQHTKSLAIYEQILKLDPQNKEVQDQIQSLRKRLGIFELPSKYESIPSSDAITREEMAALLAVKFKGIVDEMTDSPPIIIDISASWASKFILQITSHQIMGIYPNHTFQPKKTVTRAEMAKILSQFIAYLEKKGYKFIQQIPPDRIEISDVSAQNYYYQPILKMLSYNIMELSLDRAFEPDSSVSGEQAIKLLDIILALIK